MLPQRDIVIISSLEWDLLWQGPHEIALRFSEAGSRVLYIENTGVRSVHLRDTSRVLSRLKRWIASLNRGGYRQIKENLWVISPIVLPPFGGRAQTALNTRLFVPALMRSMKRLELHDPDVWTFLPTDSANIIMEQLEANEGKVVYYCVADFDELTSDPEGLQREEKRLLKRADVVFAPNALLKDRCQKHNPNTHIFPFGVNVDSLRASPSPGDRFPSGPVIGYVGGIHRHLAVELLLDACRLRSDWQWVMIGPLQTEISELRALPNVHFMGPRPHAELGGWIKRFDVCIVPYARTPFTETVVPTKINEYLALGKPVVATDLPYVVEFQRQNGVLSVIPPRLNEFLQAIETALKDTSSTEAEARMRVAELADWTLRFDQMSEIVRNAETS